MKKVEILNFNSVVSFETLENVNVITTFPLPFYTPTTSFPSLSIKRALETLEFVPANANIDDVENIGKVSVNPDNQLVFVVDPAKVMNACVAKEYIVGFIVSYLTGKVYYNTPSNVSTYNMVVERGADGGFVSSYKQSSLADIMKQIPVLDNTLNVDMTGGYVYKIFRDLSNCTKA